MWLLPLIVLVLFALHHRWRIHRWGQSSWKGGGFSMFSETERNSLITEVWVLDKGVKPVPLQVADQVDHFLRKTATAIPTPKHLAAWARWVGNAEWKRCGNFAHLPLPRQDSENLALSRVTVRHRRLVFDCGNGLHQVKEMESFTLENKGAPSRVAP